MPQVIIWLQIRVLLNLIDCRPNSTELTRIQPERAPNFLKPQLTERCFKVVNRFFNFRISFPQIYIH